MSVQVEKLENSMVKLTIEVSAEEFIDATKDAYKKQKKDIQIPGFRKGKVPQVMVEQMYGAGVFYEDAANELIPTAYADAAKECGEDIMSRPEINIVQIEKGKPFIFTAEIAVRPEVKLGAYKGVEVKLMDTSVSDEDVEDAVKKELENNARIITVEDRPVKDGDTAVIDFEGFVDGVPFEGGKGENHSLEIGSGSFIPGFEEQLIGKNTGDEFDITVTFPEDYQAEDLAGKESVFNVKINEIKTKEIPELDDDFAQDVSEFDTVDEYKESIRAKLEANRKEGAKNVQQQEAIEKIVAASEMDVPKAAIDTECENIINQFGRQMAQQGLALEQYMQYTGMTMDDMKEQYMPQAESRLKSDLVLTQIVKEEGIEASDEEVEAEVLKMAEMYGMDAANLMDMMGDEDKDNIMADIKIQKAIDLIWSEVVFVEMEDVEEASKEIAAQEEEAAKEDQAEGEEEAAISEEADQ